MRPFRALITASLVAVVLHVVRSLPSGQNVTIVHKARVLRRTLYFATQSKVLVVERKAHDVVQRCRVVTSSFEDLELDEDELIKVSEDLMSQLLASCRELPYILYPGATHRTRRGIIHPDTKWCGLGNSASNFEDLGTARETDICCRSHDNCKPFTAPFNHKYGLFNAAIWYRFGCDCDAEFYRCLKATNEPQATTVGKVYFNILSPGCMALKYPKVCSKHGWWFTCKEYKEDTTQAKKWTWVDNTLTF